MGNHSPYQTAEMKLETAQAEIARLQNRIAALVEIIRDTPCPYDGRVTVADCQQCGCSHGLLTRSSAA